MNPRARVERERAIIQLEHPDDAVSKEASENASCNNAAKSINIVNTAETDHVITLTDILQAITTCNSFVNILSHNLEGMRRDTAEDSLNTIVTSSKKLMQQLSMHDF